MTTLFNGEPPPSNSKDWLLRALAILVAVAAPVAALVWGPAPVNGHIDSARAAAWAMALLGILGLFILAGLTMKQRAFGVLIDERNRYSLSRLQMTLWGVLVISSLYAFYLANIIRSPDTTVGMQMNLDTNLIWLMGISAASFALSPLAQVRKAADATSPSELANAGQQLAATQHLEHQPRAAGQLLVKASPRDARLADLIRGEDVANANVVDIGRVQMLIITLLVLIVYGACLVKIAAHGPVIVEGLPVIHATLLGLIAVSHGGYLAGKLTPATRTDKGQGLEVLGRAMQLSQRASELARTAQTRLDSLAPNDSRVQPMRHAFGLAAAAAARAATLPSQAAVAGFDAQDLAFMQGQLDAIDASLKSFTDDAPASASVNAPSPDVVRKVQERLRSLGHGDVQVTGIPDMRTEDAARTVLAGRGIGREALDTRMYRYYEELAQLI